MNGKQDYYELLGVSRNAGEEEIKRAYRELARQHHPDIAKNKTDAEQKFKTINEAFAVLSSPEKRSRYDQFGHAGLNFSEFPEGFGFPFSAGSDFFNDVIETFFGDPRATHRRGRKNRGHDLRYDLEISLEEAYAGLTREIRVKAGTACGECKGSGSKAGGYSPCSTCGGTGQIREVQQSLFGRVIRAAGCPACQGNGEILADPCPACRGNGVVESTRKIAVSVPAGVDDGNRLRIKHEGEAGFRGGSPGDLYVFLHVKAHPLFKRENSDLYRELTISFPEAALGTELEIAALSGKEKIHIPPGTQNGDLLRLKGKGMPSLHHRGHGDLMIVVQVEVPKKLAAKQKEMLEEYARISGISLRRDKSFLGRVKDAITE